MNEEYLLSFQAHKVFENGIAFVNSSYDTAAIYFAGHSEHPGWVMKNDGDGRPVPLNSLQAKILKSVLAKQVDTANSLMRAEVKSA